MQMLSMSFKKPNSKIMCTIYAVQRQEKSSVIIYAQLSTTAQIAVLRALEASLLVQLILVFKDQHTGTEYDGRSCLIGQITAKRCLPQVSSRDIVAGLFFNTLPQA